MDTYSSKSIQLSASCRSLGERNTRSSHVMSLMRAFVMATVCCLALWAVAGFGTNRCSAQKVMTVLVGDVKFEMVQVGGGSFIMGCEPELHHVGKNDEVPQHAVKVNSFYMGRYEVTQRLWNAVMDYNPSNFVGDDYPVEQVSYDEAQEFIRRLNELTGLSFRLPTEAEWEYAARGGMENKGYTYSGSNDLMKVAWCHLNSGDSTHAVGELVPNRLGIYDLTGNVWEWCQDWYQDDYYVWCKAYSDGIPKTVQTREQLDIWYKWNWTLPAESNNRKTENPTGAEDGVYRVGRGGSWADYENDLRVSYRNFWVPDRQLSNLGFRLVLNSDAPTVGWMPNQYIIDSIVDDKIYASMTTERMHHLQEGVLEGVFSVGPDKKVHFSRGNLQYNPASHKWRFADNQYDIVGDKNLKLDLHYSGWVDLFQWASSGYRDRPPERYTTLSRSYGNGERNIDGTSFDWGVYNPIINGGNVSGRWRTLSVYEWHYMMAMRPEAALLRFTAVVGERQGLVLLPDNWLARGLDTIRPGESYRFTLDEWTSMERAGAVFLPAGGFCRMNTYQLGEKLDGEVPIEGYNVPFNTLMPEHAEPIDMAAESAGKTIFDPATGLMEECKTKIQKEYLLKAWYRPAMESSTHLGRYWTTIHYGDRQAMALSFSLESGFYVVPEERVNRMSVRLVQDVEKVNK